MLTPALLALGCQPEVPMASGPLVRDSAGVEIVESMGPIWEPGAEWRVSGAPLLTIGEGEGDDRFHGILGARRLADGRIAVVDRGSGRIRYFDPEGRLLASNGVEGVAPGELGPTSAVWWLPGDTLVVADMRGLVVFDPAGVPVRRLRLDAMEAGMPVRAVAQLDDGTLLGVSGSGGHGPAEPGVVVRDTVHVHRLAPDGCCPERLVSLPAAPLAGVPTEAGTTLRRLPFSAQPAMGSAGSDFVLTRAADPELEVWSGDGARRRIIRWAPPSRVVTLEHVSEYRDRLLASTQRPDVRRAYDRFMADAPIPIRLPATGEGLAMRVDDKGYLWVEAYRLPWDDAPRWYVFRPDGGWLGWVDMPAGFRLLQVGTDYVLGSWRDPAGVEHVRVHGLGRG